jgi:nucleoside-diphosphate-sugar epimerase
MLVSVPQRAPAARFTSISPRPGSVHAMKKVLVTGGSGFLGAALCRELVAAGYSVRVFDDLSRGQAARLERIGGAVQLIQGDIRDGAAVRAATAGCEVVWHLAYVNGTRLFYECPDRVIEVGIKGALNTLEAAIECGIRRYVLASSSEVYQQPTHVPTAEASG